jgi:glyoxylase-like metal-dependent hydrolase (beta-lactamase superfamily II)
MMDIQTFTFNPFQENTYVVSSQSEAIIIDPGNSDKRETSELDQYISDKRLSVKYLLNTHCHIDHVLGNYHVKEKYKVPFMIHANDLPVLRAVKSYAPNYGFPMYSECLPDSFIKEGDEVLVGDTKAKILFVPGHAPGHIAFYFEKEMTIISGDVLFLSSIGRTDLPGGDFDTLIDSIHQKLFTLPDDVTVYSGHGPTTTIGREKVSNPFCALSLR